MLKYSTVVLNKPNIQDFAKERNETLKGVPTEWVLYLDSDEILTPELETEINNLNPTSEINGYYVKRVGIAEDLIIRLGRKSAGRWSRCVHEVWKVKGRVGYLKNHIIHKEEKSIFETINKINFYSTLHAKANREEGKRASILKIIIFPKLKFIQIYIFKKAYKSGLKGFVFSLLQSFQSYLSWTKLYFLSFS